MWTFPNARMNTLAMTFKTRYYQKNPLSLSKVMNNLVRVCIAGNAKNQQNWSSLPRNFSATTESKNSRYIPKIVLRHVLSGNRHFRKWSGNFCPGFSWNFTSWIFAEIEELSTGGRSNWSSKTYYRQLIFKVITG